MSTARETMQKFSEAMQDADRYSRELQLRYGYSQDQIRNMAKAAVPITVRPYGNLAASFAAAKKRLEQRRKQNG